MRCPLCDSPGTCPSFGEYAGIQGLGVSINSLIFLTVSGSMLGIRFLIILSCVLFFNYPSEGYLLICFRRVFSIVTANFTSDNWLQGNWRGYNLPAMPLAEYHFFSEISRCRWRETSSDVFFDLDLDDIPDRASRDGDYIRPTTKYGRVTVCIFSFLCHAPCWDNEPV